jgi:pimeloyl-[acyl-carrier protein] methyl ester esterase
MRHATVGLAESATARVHVESVGAGRPLVLLHGFALHGGVFAPILPMLARTHRVHVVDLPGHGHSRGVPAPSLEAIVDRVAEAVADAIDRDGATLHPPAVLGWSFGGLVAIAWALRRPAGIERLALVSTTPSFVVRPGWSVAMPEDTLQRFGDELELAWRLTLQRFLTLQVQGSEDGRRTLVQLRTRLFERGEPSVAELAQTLSILLAADLRARVGSIDVPALVVTGPRDTLAPAEAGAWLARMLPAARLRTIDGAAHAPFLSHPDEFLDALAEFLDGR